MSEMIHRARNNHTHPPTVITPAMLMIQSTKNTTNSSQSIGSPPLEIDAFINLGEGRGHDVGKV
jgi:hypothetical protein